MRRLIRLIIGGTVLALASASAFAHDEVGFGLAIAVPGAAGYVGSAPMYAPPPVYVAPPTVYYAAPPTGYYAPPPSGYYQAPPRVYYGGPPGLSIYYGLPGERYRDWHDWHGHHGHWRDDDDD